MGRAFRAHDPQPPAAVAQDCIFELADVWVKGLSPLAYLNFLEDLFGKIAEFRTDGDEPGTFFWKHSRGAFRK